MARLPHEFYVEYHDGDFNWERHEEDFPNEPSAIAFATQWSELAGRQCRAVKVVTKILHLTPKPKVKLAA